MRDLIIVSFCGGWGVWFHPISLVSHKKQVLMRWQGSKVSEEATLPSSKESSNHTCEISILAHPYPPSLVLAHALI